MKRTINKEGLIEMCALVTTCIRDYQSLYRQYRYCIYNEVDLFKSTASNKALISEK